jgi:polo-like kinase 1
MEKKEKKDKKAEKDRKTKDFSLKKNYKCGIRHKFINEFKMISKKKNNKSVEKQTERKLKDFNKITLKLVCDSRKINFEYNKKVITISNKDGSEEKVEYINEGELGKGAFGVCYLYESTLDWIQYAAKIVRKEILSKDKTRQSIIEEINTQKSLDSPKVVKVKSYSEDTENVYIILELCKNRSLSDLVKKRHYLTEFEVRNYMFQLIQGVKYLHNQKIIHRDLKPNNIFLDEKLELKIGDFGLIAKINKDRERRHTYCGTVAYMAPEVIKSEKGYSFEVDIWSIGVIMYNLLTGTVPFYDQNKDNTKIHEKILKGIFTFPEDIKISEIAKDLIRQILVLDPKKRPGLNQILYHDFFHIGTFPRFLDLSTLKSAPSKEYLRKYISEDEENSLLKKEVNLKRLYKLIINNISKISYNDIEKYTLQNAPKVNEIDYYVSYFHISHYGFCYYELNNGMVGILYEGEEKGNYDGEKLILNEKEDKFYEIIEDDFTEAKIKEYSVDKCPVKLKPKFDEFLKYHNKIRQKLCEIDNQSLTSESNMSSFRKDNIDEENSEIEYNKTTSIKSSSSVELQNSLESKKKEEVIIYIKNVYKNDNAKFLTLSDETKQIIFKDKIEILISDKKEVVGYTDRHKKTTFIPLAEAMKNASKDFTTRLKYIKHVNFSQIKEKMKIKLENNKNQFLNDMEKEKSNYSNND